MNFSKLIQLTFLCFVTIIGTAQSLNKNDQAPTPRQIELIEYDANQEFEYKHFEDAVSYYTFLDSLKPNNGFYNLRLAKSYDEIGKRELAMVHYEKALQNNSKDEKIPLYLAKIEHHYLDFDAAFTHYEAYLVTATDSAEIAKTKVYIDQCKHAIEFTNNPMELNIRNLGETINSEDPEYAAIIDSKDSTLVYTARRKFGKSPKIDNLDGKYFEDIYISKRKPDGTWSEGKNIESINTKYHEASVSLSADAKRIYFYRGNSKPKKSGIYESTFEPNKKGELNWSAPVYLNKNINQPNTFTPSASITTDGDELYFTSDRDGGYGGLDIYYSKKMSNGEWGPATNLGPTINTAFDEDAPFIHHSNEILVFSSKGHNSMGGYDNFYSIMESKGNDDTDEVWGQPVNLGVPINSAGDDIFFMWTADESHGYFSSAREGGNGDKDIYVVDMPENSSDYMTMKGHVYDSLTNEPLEDISIVANKKEDGEFVKRVYTDKNGKYVLPLKEGETYVIKVDMSNYIAHEEDVTIENKKVYYELTKDFKLLSISEADSLITSARNERDSTSTSDSTLDNNTNNTEEMKIVIRDILFDFDKSNLQQASIVHIEKVAQLLSNNKNVTIKIIGHTDSTGDEIYNQKLSEKRAKSVQTYLITKKGIDPEQLTIVGKGETEPYTSNNSASGRKLNRRVEFKIAQNK